MASRSSESSNEKGAERAIATERVTRSAIRTISATFLRKNQNQSPKENFKY
jgi:hypothetical protein